MLTLSTVLVAGLLLSPCIAIGQNLFPLNPWLLVIAVHSVLGKACGASVPDGHRNAIRENCNDANHSTSVLDVSHQILSSPALDNKTQECSSVEDTC